MEVEIYFQIIRKPNIDRKREGKNGSGNYKEHHEQSISIHHDVSLKYATGIGTYASFDIAAFDTFNRCLDNIVFDVTSDRDLALRMCERFNRYQLSPIHLKEAILDMIE